MSQALCRALRPLPVLATLALLLAATGPTAAVAQQDPGPRPGPAGAGGPLAGLSADELALFAAVQARFAEVDSVSGSVAGEGGSGLGPTFNGNSCAQCHAQPAPGGTSPHPALGQVRLSNPQLSLATLDRLPGKAQPIPPFLRADGPVREARFVRNPDGSPDGGVHGLFTIAGRIDAPTTCQLAPPDFATALAQSNVIFRIPTPLFGGGLLEAVTDAALQANLAATANTRSFFGIGGRFNGSGNDGTITRFGWKAQNKSLEVFAGEAYNVEQGVTNDLFPNERSGIAGCLANPLPEDTINLRAPGGGTTGTAAQLMSDVTAFAFFARLLAPPAPTTHTASEQRGQQLFAAVGCTLCHSDTLVTGPTRLTGQTGVTLHPYSDLALHHLGPGLADNVAQGAAGPDEFRTAPLWGAGQRVFFLHDGRAGPANGGLLTAILAHQSSDPNCWPWQQTNANGVACQSEANLVVQLFQTLSPGQQQDLLNFLRSL